eukprot:gene10595-2927_t
MPAARADPAAEDLYGALADDLCDTMWRVIFSDNQLVPFFDTFFDED